MTRLGRVRYSRTYYYDSASESGCSPLDEALGISEELSNGVRHDIVKLGVGRTFAEAAEVYEELMRVKIGTSTVWDKTQVAGMLARPALNPISTTRMVANRPSSGMMILMDGFMAPVRKEGWNAAQSQNWLRDCICTHGRNAVTQDRQRTDGSGARLRAILCHASGWPGRIERQTGR